MREAHVIVDTKGRVKLVGLTDQAHAKQVAGEMNNDLQRLVPYIKGTYYRTQACKVVD